MPWRPSDLRKMALTIRQKILQPAVGSMERKRDLDS